MTGVRVSQPVDVAAWPPASSAPLRWAEIDVAALRANAAALCAHAGRDVEMIAMVKANGYGHGAVTAARAFVEGGARRLGVSSAEEALQLRAAGVEEPILSVGWTPAAHVRELVDARIDLAVFDIEAIERIREAAGGATAPARVHLKVDTGMGRVGVRPEHVGEALEALVAASPRLRVHGVFTHFADADGVDPAFTERQHHVFKGLVEAVRAVFPEAMAHCANSAATLRFPAMHHDAVRPGIALYGYAPPGAGGIAALAPAMTVRALVTQVKTVRPGDTVGYGRTWTATRSTRIATIAAGYADGVQRAQSNAGSVLVRGVRCPIVGRVSMDQLTADVSAASRAAPGDVAVIVGGERGGGPGEWLGADEVAAAAGTISYEVICGVSARVPRRLVEGA